MTVLSRTFAKTLAVIAGATLGCASGRAAPVRTQAAAPEISQEFAVIEGPDTVAFELVTRCPTRVISDISLRRPHAALHYEAALRGAFPEVVELGIWSGADSSNGPPTQVARHHVEGDTAVTEVWKRGAAQVQRTRVDPGTFPYWWNYVGLLNQLLEIAGTKGDGDTVPILYVASGGYKGLVRVVRHTDDSLVVRIDSMELATDWTKRDGLRGAQLTGTAHRIVRTPLNAGFAAMRCNLPPLLRFGPGGQAPVPSRQPVSSGGAAGDSRS